MPTFTIFDPLPRNCKKDPYKSQRCTHHHKTLRGCWLPKGHAGPHDNPNLRQFQTGFTTWTDADGNYINSKQDWINHIDALEGTGENLGKDLKQCSDVQKFLNAH